MRRGTDAQGFEILALHVIGAFPPNHANGFPPSSLLALFHSSSAPVSFETHPSIVILALIFQDVLPTL
jgi:hypothetical protein